MIGMGWRGKDFGDRLTLDDSGKEIITPQGQGDGSGHRYTGPFAITIRDASLPDHSGHAA
jgi:hypothetical protein